jgi:hypothetical protein
MVRKIMSPTNLNKVADPLNNSLEEFLEASSYTQEL